MKTDYRQEHKNDRIYFIFEANSANFKEHKKNIELARNIIGERVNNNNIYNHSTYINLNTIIFSIEDNKK